MNLKLKNYLGGAIIVSVLVLTFSAWSYVNFYGKSIQPSSFRSFSVSGEGKVTAVPDVAEFDFSVITEGEKDIASLQKENTEKTNKAIGFVKSSGVEAKDIRTKNYNLSPRYKNFNCGNGAVVCPPPEIVGYSIIQVIEVKVRDFGKIGDILSGVIQNGANSVSALFFRIDNPAQKESEARAAAIAEAREKAKAVAKAGGFKIGRLLSIDENAPPIFYRDFSVAGKGVPDAAPMPLPEIEPGSQEIIVNVFLRYEIE